MFGAIIAVVVVSLMLIAAVTRHWYKRRQDAKKRRSEEPKPLVFIAGSPRSSDEFRAHICLGITSPEVAPDVASPPPIYRVDAPPSYADASRKESQVV
jgi:hypothetical protein